MTQKLKNDANLNVTFSVVLLETVWHTQWNFTVFTFKRSLLSFEPLSVFFLIHQRKISWGRDYFVVHALQRQRIKFVLVQYSQMVWICREKSSLPLYDVYLESILDGVLKKVDTVTEVNIATCVLCHARQWEELLIVAL